VDRLRDHQLEERHQAHLVEVRLQDHQEEVHLLDHQLILHLWDVDHQLGHLLDVVLQELLLLQAVVLQELLPPQVVVDPAHQHLQVEAALELLHLHLAEEEPQQRAVEAPSEEAEQVHQKDHSQLNLLLSQV